MDEDDFVIWFREELEQAEEEAAGSHKVAMNSYGAGYDCGYVAALKAAHAALWGDG